MTTFTAVPTEDDIFKAVGNFLQDILPEQTPAVGPTPAVLFVVIVGQENRVPEPKEDNYIVMWPLRMPRLATNFVSDDGVTQQRSTRQNMQVALQLDVHGAQAFNNSNRISTLFRDGFATEFFEDYPNISPLYAGDPRNAPFISGERQYEDRYIVEVELQVNFTMTATAQSARTLTADIIDVETDPNSWPNSTVTVTGT